ncbi:IS110 family transposase [Actinomycetaceae bacterium WB03_NA08]|uniref:IS110 family transposase n=1 Tax=Scrofimicrobium canadense TaxID=2652290 RepID=A0A6N7WB66_9ACTO|nr:IS110 family transposase [Scrofimicrobium canadense]MSS85418.1 IS110 family transposase [Scrofimicrobium canadense]
MKNGRKHHAHENCPHTYQYVVGVDTHARSHTLAIIDAATAAKIDVAHFPSTPAGSARCISWMTRRTKTKIVQVLISMEGTNSYGSGLRESMENSGFQVVEAPLLQIRGKKRAAKSDTLDAVQIAIRTLPIPIDRLTVPRNGDERQALRILLGTRSQMTRLSTATINALTALARTNNLGVDARRPLSKKQIRQISAWRTRDADSLSQRIARDEAKRLATRITSLWEETKDNLMALDTLTTSMSPALRAMKGIGPVSAAQFLISWSHPGRIHSEAAFASLAGASPIPASSGNTQKHRLNRGGDRQLNQALHTVILVRIRTDPDTKTYVEKRTQEGKNKRETMRCLKRYLARKIHRTLTKEQAAPRETAPSKNVA